MHIVFIKCFEGLGKKDRCIYHITIGSSLFHSVVSTEQSKNDITD